MSGDSDMEALSLSCDGNILQDGVSNEHQNREAGDLRAQPALRLSEASSQAEGSTLTTSTVLNRAYAFASPISVIKLTAASNMPAISSNMPVTVSNASNNPVPACNIPATMSNVSSTASNIPDPASNRPATASNIRATTSNLPPLMRNIPGEEIMSGTSKPGRNSEKPEVPDPTLSGQFHALSRNSGEPPAKIAKKGNRSDVSFRSDDEDDGETCSICLEPWTNSGEHRLIALKCGHVFGYSCVKKWLQVKPLKDRKCPFCNTKASLRDVRFLYTRRLIAVDTSKVEALKLELETTKKEKARIELKLQQAQETAKSTRGRRRCQY